MKPQLTCLFLLLAAPLLHAQSTPTLMSYQGRVTDAGGVLIGNSSPVNRTVTFQLYTASSGGTTLYAETQTVTISGGEFSVLIGNGTGISGRPGPSSPAAQPYKTLSDIINSTSYGSLYLGVIVDDGTAAADPEISPRQQIVSGAFALRAKVAESVAGGAVTTAMLGDGQVSSSKITAGAVDSSRIADSSILGADIANNTITADKINTSSMGLWAPSGSNIYRNSNVGIGTADPTAPIQVTASNNIYPSYNGVYVYNPTNSSGNHAIVSTRVAGSSGGNPFISFDVANVAGWSAGIDNNDAQKFKISADWANVANNNKLTIDRNGYVGISQGNPGFPLNFGSYLGDKIALFGNSGNHYGLGIQNSLLQIHTDQSSTDVAFGYGSSGNMTETMRIKGNGNVGIGTSNPTSKLTIQDGSLWLTSTSGTGYGGGVGGVMAANDGWRIFGHGNNENDGSLYIETYDDGNEPIIFRQSGNERMRIASNGFIGIGTNNPGCPLVVNSSSDIDYTSEDYIDKDGFHGVGAAAVHQAVSIFASSRIIAPVLQVNSDQRVKSDVHPTDNKSDLQTLMGIEISDYYYKDSLKFGNKAQKKVIAQQVEKIYPLAVDTSTDVVPDIFKKAAIKDGWIELATDLKVGEQVRLVDGKRPATYKVLEVRKGAFRVESCPDVDKVFVYGREVDDFRTVDYDAIAMLNVSATQQIKREKDAEINALKTKNAELEARLSALEKLSAAK